ncbi:3-dehydroquinate synthase [Aeromicrobium terrae]|uniref:3-dehydroquinate synthase n=1 Tax=Aeromicrobium terrae TaxID=2498846 RepID=A0A5C8NPY7_9ACTN|nr:3-dehydroquinate synthase [Aeromicrobium terrae]TXL62975.1 3-dehydroquinate synthase [Aeromicrobium terrae]
MTTRLTVATGAPYDVVIGHGVLSELRGLVGTDARRVAVVHSPTLQDRAEALRSELTELDVHLLEVPDGEAAKNADVLTSCWRTLGEAGFTRSDVVIGLGGGATTDLAGFVAASWLRGVRFVNLPTTVLGMVDAAVGGKTGINTEAGKNLVGAFHEPAGVLCELDVLATLPPEEVRSGLAEVAKCGFIADPTILELIEAAPEAVADTASPLVAELITKGIAVKAAVVAGDLKETGPGGSVGREALNYGHTLGHALERVNSFGIRHGEAISVGMVFVAELAHRSGRIDADLLERHRSVLRSLGLPTTDETPFDTLLEAMRLDKKTRGTQLRFVVLDDLARPAVLAGPDDDLLREAHAALRP